MAITRAAQPEERPSERLEHEVRILELLQRTGAMLASKLDVHGVVQTAIDAATDLSGAQVGAVFYMHGGQERDAVSRDARSGAPREAFTSARSARAVPLLAQTFVRGEAVLRTELDAGELPPGDVEIQSYLAVPLVLRSGDLVGGVFLGHPEPRAFDDTTRRLVTGIAAQAAIALDNARLYEETRRISGERAAELDRERARRLGLEHVIQKKDELLAVLSHELRAPLHAILGWAEVLLARRDGGDPQRGLESIARNARAQAQLIEDLLDLNRIVAGKLRLELRRTDLVAAVHAALDDVRAQARAKQLELTYRFEPPELICDADPQRLQQIVWNLLSNAVKYTPSHGAVELIARAAGDTVELTVRDTGCGIRAELLPTLFDRTALPSGSAAGRGQAPAVERFRQPGGPQIGHHGGLGLGLAIVKPLVELHGGTIEAHSAGVGHGATFTVRLPVRVADAVAPLPVAPTPRGAPPAASLAGVRVLVIDDDADARELIHAILTDARADAVLAASADEGLALLRELRPDVIVSDIGMALRDGYQLIRLVRTMPAAAGGRTPALALTAFAQSEDRARALLAGYQDHVAKPVDARQLVAAVRRLSPNASEGGPDA